jgi:hypothetical protein
MRHAQYQQLPIACRKGPVEQDVTEGDPPLENARVAYQRREDVQLRALTRHREQLLGLFVTLGGR